MTLFRDLAARNCLVAGTQEDFVVKVSDFGLSRRMRQVHCSAQHAVSLSPALVLGTYYAAQWFIALSTRTAKPAE